MVSVLPVELSANVLTERARAVAAKKDSVPPIHLEDEFTIWSTSPPMPAVREVLREPNHRVVDRRVAVGVIFTHDFTDQAGRLAVGPPGDESRFLRGKLGTAGS